MRAAGLVVMAAFVVAACSSASGVTAGPSTAPVELTVYAASSLKGALEAVKTAYPAAAPGMNLKVATDASSTLRTQIEQGAPDDVFLSADQTNPMKLVDDGLADGTAVDFAGNTLVVIVPTANPAGIATIDDLSKPGDKIIAAGADVPITKYATQVVANVARLDAGHAGFVAAYAANVVSKEDNVRAIVAKIELGEGDAAIVYATDARASTKVKTINIPVAANVPATYAGVVVKASTHRDAAQAFLAWLAGPEGQRVLATFGFLPPS